MTLATFPWGRSDFLYKTESKDRKWKKQKTFLKPWFELTSSRKGFPAPASGLCGDPAEELTPSPPTHPQLRPWGGMQCKTHSGPSEAHAWESVEHTEVPAQQIHAGLGGTIPTLQTWMQWLFQEPEMWKPQHSFAPGCRTSRTQTFQPEHTSQLPVVKFHMFENSSSPVGDVTFHANFMPLFSYEHTCNPPWLTGKASWLTAGRLLTVHHSKRRGMCNEIIKSRRKTYLEPASDHRWVLLGKRRCV